MAIVSRNKVLVFFFQDFHLFDGKYGKYMTVMNGDMILLERKQNEFIFSIETKAKLIDFISMNP